MKKFLSITLLILSTAFAFSQGIKISALPTAPANIAAGIVPMSIGSTTYKAPADSIAALARVQLTSDDGSMLFNSPSAKVLNMRTATAAAGDRIVSYGGGVILEDSTITAIPNIIVQRGPTRDTIPSSVSWDLNREASGVYRMYVVIVDINNDLDTVMGATDTINAVEPPMPDGAIKLATITVIGSAIGEPHLVGTWQQYAVLKTDGTGKQVTDSADLGYKDRYLTVGGSTQPGGTAGIIYAADRARDIVGISGRLFNVGSGTGGGGVYDPSKSFRFANRGNNYLTIGSTSNDNHIMQLQNGTKIHYQAPIRTSLPDSLSAYDGDTLVKIPSSLLAPADPQGLQSVVENGSSTTNSITIVNGGTGAGLNLTDASGVYTTTIKNDDAVPTTANRTVKTPNMDGTMFLKEDPMRVRCEVFSFTGAQVSNASVVPVVVIPGVVGLRTNIIAVEYSSDNANEYTNNPVFKLNGSGFEHSLTYIDFTNSNVTGGRNPIDVPLAGPGIFQVGADVTLSSNIPFTGGGGSGKGIRLRITYNQTQ